MTQDPEVLNPNSVNPEKISSSYSSVASPWDGPEPEKEEEGESSKKTEAEPDTRALDLIGRLPAINGSRLSTKFAPRIGDLLSGGWAPDAIYRNLTSGTNGANSAGIYASKLRDMPTNPPVAKVAAPTVKPEHLQAVYAPFQSHEELGVTKCDHGRVRAVCPHCSGLTFKARPSTPATTAPRAPRGSTPTGTSGSDKDAVLGMLGTIADSLGIPA